MIATGKSIPYILRTPVPLPLDGLDSSTFVYGGGFVQLLSDYSGAAVRIRRASDNAETDIGFVDGVADVAAMEAHGTDCYLVKIYDQVGTGVYWERTVAAEQLTVVKSGSAVVQGTGIPGALNEVGFFSCNSVNFTYPKDFTEMSCYSSEAGGQLLGKGGSWSIANQNGWRNNSQDSTTIESQHYIRNSGGGLMFSKFLSDVAAPANGVHLSLYCDDTNGSGIARNQDTELSGTWTPARNATTTNKTYFNRLTTLSSGTLTQHYSIMLNTATDQATVEQRLFNIMGI